MGILPVYFDMWPLAIDMPAFAIPNGRVTSPIFQIPMLHVMKDCEKLNE